MSQKDPMMKHVLPTANFGSPAKVFFAANELLQHVKRENCSPAVTRKQRKRYSYKRLHAASPGLYVSGQPDTQLTSQTHSVHTERKLSHSEERLTKWQPLDTSMSLFGAHGSQQYSKQRLDTVDDNGCSGQSIHEAERKRLKLEDKQTYQQYGSMAAPTKSCVAGRLGSKRCIKERRTSQQNYGNVQICFFKMSSLHSPRTQCCCCAVGVFAAMFGIFMLSAGICIVLNVTFMEVDTSGLPPDLHNEHGKKVVGIILICVAIACLGLSATVSIMYFTLCSRKSPDVTKQPKMNPVGTSTAGQERVRSRDSALTGKRRGPSSSLNVVPVHRPGMHLHSEFSKQKKSYHVLRNRPVLPPHQEEEVDFSKTSVELNRADETFSASTTSFRRKLRQKDRIEETVESLHVISSTSIRTPVIIVDTFHEKEVLGEDEMETQMNDSVIRFDEDSVSNTFSERCEEAEPDASVFNRNVLVSGATSSSVASGGPAILRHTDLSKLDFKSHTEHLDTASIQTQLSDCSSALVSSSCTSLSERHQHVLVVRPATDASPGSLTNIHSPVDGLSDINEDSLSNLPVTSAQHYNTHKVLLHEESREGLTRVHDNSAFSHDGNDPPHQSKVES